MSLKRSVRFGFLGIFMVSIHCGNGTSPDESDNLPDSDSAETATSSDTDVSTVTDSDTSTNPSEDTEVDSNMSVPDPPRLPNPMSGFATHYWDCCKPHCGWKGNATNPVQSCDQNDNLLSGFDEQSACAGGSAFQCWSYGPWAVSDTLSYGFAAHNGVDCGTCFQLEFDGTGHHNPTDPGAATLSNKFMIVQVLNTGGIAQEQFDLLIPGGGVGDFDACTKQWGLSDLGERYGGYFLKCRNDHIGNLRDSIDCAKNKCHSAFSFEDKLLKSCLWWAEWGSVADNPNLKYGEVECPQAIRDVSGM